MKGNYLRAAALTAGVVSAGWGAYDLLRQQEDGMNKMRAAALMIGSQYEQEYSRKLIPGAAAFWGGSLLVLAGAPLKRRKIY
ncbi:MAG TPA: hypothetical protein VJI12_04240 [archaeon]|nr:hypothetical protein [archaeon]